MYGIDNKQLADIMKDDNHTIKEQQDERQLQDLDDYTEDNHTEFATQFSAAAKSYIAELQALGSEIDTKLATCESRALVTSHRAFAYLAKRADIRQVAIAGVNPEEEPSAKSLEAIAAFAKANKVSG